VHELRSPLTAVKGYAQLLLRQARRLGLPPQVTHAVEAVEQEATRMAEMIGEMHDALRIRRGDLVVHPAPVDLLPLVEHAVTAQRAAFPRHEIAVEAPGGPLVGEWEPQRVEQVVGHLVNNAARYTPSGGGVHVGVSRVADGGQALVMVCVRDSGVGVAEPDRGHIFEYLYRSPEAMRRNLSGLGLGLFLSRSLVERMGGRLWLAETRTGETRTGETRTGESHGSTFCFTLPLVGSGAA